MEDHCCRTEWTRYQVAERRTGEESRPFETDGGRPRSRITAPEFNGWGASATPGDTDGEYTRTHEWTLWGDQIEWEFSIPISIVEYCSNRLRTGAYTRYLVDPFQEPFIVSLADRLREHCRTEYNDPEQAFLAALRFVQNIDYSLDVNNTGHEIYPKYAIETLTHLRGDCEDGTILLGSLLRALGYDVAVLVLPGAKHMMLGVAGEEFSGASVDHEGTHYYVVETTDVGWDPGELPPEYGNSTVQVQVPDEVPVLVHEWTAVPRRDAAVEASVHVANYGDTPVKDVRVQLDFERRDGTTVVQRPIGYRPETLKPGDSVDFAKTLRFPAEREVRGRCQVITSRQLHDESMSDYR